MLRLNTVLFLLFTITALPLAATSADDLAAAVEQGNLDRVKAIVASGVSVNALSSKGQTALVKACSWYKCKIALWLIKSGADVNNLGRKDRRYWSALTWCAYKMTKAWTPYYLPVMRSLLAHGADPNLTSQKGGKFTALMFAASNGNKKAVKLLLAKGADRTLKHWKGKTAADMARAAGHEEIALLLEGKSSASYLSSLHYAAKNGKTAQVRTLLAQGANCNTVDHPSRRSALYYAAKNGHLAIVRMLLNSGANPDLQDTTGHTALMQAVNHERKAVAMLLINRGANMKLRTIKDGARLCWQSNASVLEFALVRRMTEVVRAAIAKGVPVDGDDEYWVPMFYTTMSTCRTADLKHIRMLLAAGARPKPKLIERLQKFSRNDPLAGRMLDILRTYTP